jgi:hypothetical protein
MTSRKRMLSGGDPAAQYEARYIQPAAVTAAQEVQEGRKKIVIDNCSSQLSDQNVPPPLCFKCRFSLSQPQTKGHNFFVTI